MNRGIYFGLSQNFTTWEAIARKTIEITGSKSRIVVEDKGYGDQPYLFDLGKIQREFGLAFDSTAVITEHLKWLVEAAK